MAAGRSAAIAIVAATARNPIETGQEMDQDAVDIEPTPDFPKSGPGLRMNPAQSQGATATA